MIARLFNGSSDWIKLPFGFFYGNPFIDGSAITMGLWIMSSDSSGSDVALISSEAAVSGIDSNLGVGFYWNKDELIIKYYYGSGTFEEKSVLLTTPMGTPMFVGFSVVEAGGVPTFKFYAGLTPDDIVQVGSDQVGSGQPKTSSRQFAMGCRTTGNNAGMTPDGVFFSGRAERWGYFDSIALSLEQIKFFAATGSAYLPGENYESLGVGFDFEGSDPEYDNNVNFWATDSITGTIVEAPIAPQVWRKIQDLNPPTDFISPEAFVDVDDGLLIGGYPAGDIWKSIDEGETWIGQNPVTGVNGCNCLLNLGGGIVLAGGAFSSGDGRIFKSTDGGATWTDVQALGSTTIVEDLVLLENGTVLAGTNVGGQVYKSTNQGDTWSTAGALSGQTFVFSLCEIDSGVVLAGADSNKIFRSTDYGDSWTEIATLSPSSAVGAVDGLYKLPSNPLIVLACTGFGDMYYSDDEGITWARSYGNTNYMNSGNFVGPLSNGCVYVYLENMGGVWESSDNGATWLRVYSVPGETGSNTSIFAFSDRLLVVNKGWYTDNVNIWELIPLGIVVTPSEVSEIVRQIEYLELEDLLAQTCSLIPRVRIRRLDDLIQVMELTGFEFLRYTKVWQGIGEFELIINGQSEKALEMLEKGIVGNIGSPSSINNFILEVSYDGVSDFAGIIDYPSVEWMEDGTEMLRLVGPDLKRWLADRIVVPPTGIEQDSYAGVQETIIKSMVDRHLINPIATDALGFNDAQRAIDYLLLATDLIRGSATTFEGRGQTLFSAISEVSNFANEFGFDFYIQNDQVLFDIFNGEDRSDYVVFDIALGNVSHFKAEWDGMTFSTHVLLAGQGEGIARTMRTAQTSPQTYTGPRRRELFQDARDLNTSAKLLDRGTAVIHDRSRILRLSANKLQSLGPCYKEDFNLGDLVTVRNSKYNVSQAVKIYEVQVIHQAQRAPQVSLTWNTPSAPSALKLIREDISPGSSRT